jgi:RNA polymerase sigma factor (sigma-70 family)
MSLGDPATAVELLRMAQAGDEGALGKLLKKVGKAVTGKVSSILGTDSPYVDDIASDAMSAAATALAQCKAVEDSQVFAWFLTIARNASLQELRREARTYGEMWSTSDEPSRLVCRFPPHLQAALLEALPIVRAGLDEPTARILEMRVLEDTSWADIARALTIKPDAARVRFERLRAKLNTEILKVVLENAAERGKDGEAVKHYLAVEGLINLPPD